MPQDSPIAIVEEAEDDFARAQWEQRPLHRALVAFMVPSRLSTLQMGVILLALGLVTGLVWWRTLGNIFLAVGAAFLYLLFVALDWALLASLPRLKLSFGPVKPPLLALAVLRLSLTAALVLLWAVIPIGSPLGIPAVINLSLSAGIAYACLIEPFALKVSRVDLAFRKLSLEPPTLRVVQITDIHLERTTKRERKLVALVKSLQPDLILMTGDYLNHSYIGEETAIEHVRFLIQELEAPCGIYAVPGTPLIDPPEVMGRIFDGLGVKVLENESVKVTIAGQEIHLVGVSCTGDLGVDRPRLERALAVAPPEAFKILLCHMPDLVDEAAAWGIDLYLAGHTHGGQLRLPFYGAVVTSSNHGKRYEMGLFREGETYLYVSRGIGMEGLSAPRARFLCPPEVTLFTLQGSGERIATGKRSQHLSLTSGRSGPRSQRRRC